MNYESMGLLVFPDFIDVTEEAEIMSGVVRGARSSTPLRNKISRYGSVKPYGSYIVSQTVPDFLDRVSVKLCEKGLLSQKPTSVTVNEYLEGQSIPYHIDSMLAGPVITILSLLGSAKMRFRQSSSVFEIDYPPRCLIQLKGEVRERWEHHVPPVPGPRYSLVFRFG